MERPRAPSINSRSRSLIASVNRPEAGGPGPDHLLALVARAQVGGMRVREIVRRREPSG